MNIYFPKNNLGCLGIKIGGFYADLSICMGGVLLFGNLRGFKFFLSRKTGYRRVS